MGRRDTVTDTGGELEIYRRRAMNTTVIDKRPATTSNPIPDGLEWLFQGRRHPTNMEDLPHSPASDIPSNLLKTWESLWLQVDLPGIDIETLQVVAVGRQVRLSGKRRLPRIEGATTVWNEIPPREFSEVYTLPEEVDGGKAEAHYQHGILTVRMPKLSYLRSKAVPIDVVD
jgi:HSP20 family protein